MAKTKEKRSVDMQIMRDWVEPGARVLDLGCGRGVLLEYLKNSRKAETIGVDLDPNKIHACIKRGVNAYLGDMTEFMEAFPDKHFDRVLCSRTVQELGNPTKIIREALRVSKNVTVGFVNYAYWRNRISMLTQGSKVVNEVYPDAWWDSRPANPVSVNQFEAFCEAQGFVIERSVYLRGDWKREAKRVPNWFCGYAIYDLSAGHQ
ncbi:methyltransferase domain-containing protein [Puniceicoccaceae bacterium K14]|nr:methyltransferase domain-containing protein [Puniceicoccaceae bacterium K14]